MKKREKESERLGSQSLKKKMRELDKKEQTVRGLTEFQPDIAAATQNGAMHLGHKEAPPQYKRGNKKM